MLLKFFIHMVFPIIAIMIISTIVFIDATKILSKDPEAARLSLRHHPKSIIRKLQVVSSSTQTDANNATTTTTSNNTTNTLLTELVTRNYTGLTLVVPGIGELNTNQINDFERVTKTWFENYYNDRPVLGITRIDTSVNVMNQRVSQSQQDQQPISNTLILNQVVNYEYQSQNNKRPFEPEQYVTAPFADQIANRNYRTLLSNNNDVFITIVIDQTNRLVPEIPGSGAGTTTTSNTTEDKDDKKCFSIGALIGVAIGSAIFTALVAELILLKYRQPSQHFLKEKVVNEKKSGNSNNNDSSCRQTQQMMVSSSMTAPSETMRQSSMRHTDRITDDNNNNNYDDAIRHRHNFHNDNDVRLGGIVGIASRDSTSSRIRAAEPEGDLIGPNYKDQVRQCGGTTLTAAEPPVAIAHAL